MKQNVKRVQISRKEIRRARGGLAVRSAVRAGPGYIKIGDIKDE